MPVYDDEDRSNKSNANQSNGGVDSSDDANNDTATGSLSPDDLAGAEKSATTPDNTEADASEKSAAGIGESDVIGEGFRNEGSSRRIRITRKQGIIGAIVGSLAAGSFGISGILQGPLQLIHKGQLLSGFHMSRNEDMGNDRSAKFFLYALSGKAAKGRLGVLSNGIADKVELRMQRESGLKSVYDTRTGRLNGYQITDPEKAGSFLSELEKDGISPTNSLTGTDINGAPIRANSNGYISLREDQFKNRRSITRLATRSTDLDAVSSRLASRLLIKRGGVNFHPLKNVTRKATDDFFRWRENIQRENAKSHATGETPDLNSTPPEDPPGDVDVNLPEGSARSRILTKLRSIANTAKGPLLAAGIYCGVTEFSASIDEQNYENAQQAVRVGMSTVTVSSQLMSGQDVNFDIIGALDELNYDEDTGTSWASDPGIQAESGEAITGVDYNAGSKPGSGDKPLVFELLDSIPSIPEVGGVGLCDAMNLPGNTPGVREATELFSSLLNSALSTFGIPTPEELLGKAIDYFSTGGVDLLAEGAKRGGLENIGVRLASNDQFLAMGARELNGTEATQSRLEARAELEHDITSLGFFDKYLDPYNAYSLAGTSLRKIPATPTDQLQSFANLPSLISGSVLNLFTNTKVSAATEYDYGFPLYGFSESERAAPTVQDPFVNGEYIEEGNRLEDMNSEYGDECFGMTIDRAGNLVYSDAVDAARLPDKCKSNDPELLRYRMYVFDMVNGHSLACYEGIEVSCAQIGFGESTGAQSGGGGEIIDGFKFPLETTKDEIGNRSIFSNGDTQINHPYIAYDIYVRPGTPVVSSTAGEVKRVNPSSRCPNGSGGIGLAITVYNEQENKTFFYQHLQPGSQRVTVGQMVEPGTLLGEIGGESAGCFTTPHLHIDASNGPTRGGCSRQNPDAPGCPTVRIGRELFNTYETLPE